MGLSEVFDVSNFKQKYKVIVNNDEVYDCDDISKLYVVLRLLHYRLSHKKDVSKIEIFNSQEVYFKEYEARDKKELENYIASLNQKIFSKIFKEKLEEKLNVDNEKKI